MSRVFNSKTRLAASSEDEDAVHHYYDVPPDEAPDVGFGGLLQGQRGEKDIFGGGGEGHEPGEEALESSSSNLQPEPCPTCKGEAAFTSLLKDKGQETYKAPDGSSHCKVCDDTGLVEPTNPNVGIEHCSKCGGTGDNTGCHECDFTGLTVGEDNKFTHCPHCTDPLHPKLCTGCKGVKVNINSVRPASHKTPDDLSGATTSPTDEQLDEPGDGSSLLQGLREMDTESFHSAPSALEDEEDDFVPPAPGKLDVPEELARAEEREERAPDGPIGESDDRKVDTSPRLTAHGPWCKTCGGTNKRPNALKIQNSQEFRSQLSHYRQQGQSQDTIAKFIQDQLGCPGTSR